MALADAIKSVSSLTDGEASLPTHAVHLFKGWLGWELTVICKLNISFVNV